MAILGNLMEQLVKDLELGTPLTTEVPGVYSFPLDLGLSVIISEIPRGFSLKCSICPLPQTNDEQILTQAMLANLFGQGTRGSILGLSSEGSILTLTQVIDYTVDYKEFRDILEDFINSVDFWREETLAQSKT